MPAVVKLNSLTSRSGRSRDRVASSPLEVLRHVSGGHYASVVRQQMAISRSHFSVPDDGIRSVVPNKNGFTYTVIRAWQQDLHLKIRPDNFWLAILAQLSFFVNGNAEALRPVFVAHQGRTELVVDARPATVETVDIGVVA
jgi:hypothetical protein